MCDFVSFVSPTEHSPSSAISSVFGAVCFDLPGYHRDVAAKTLANASYDELGLATEAATIDVLEYKLQEMIPELAELNGVDLPRPIRFTLVSTKTTRAFA